MNKYLLAIGLLIIILSFSGYIKTIWTHKTGYKVYTSEDLYNASDSLDNWPWWKSKSIIIMGSITLESGNINIPSTMHFKNDSCITGKGVDATTLKVSE